ncbi:MAG: hypothetical protein M0P13_05155 [Fibrobacteraceae bacterium]|nr:hypothetical protein [Fibrobacteraceae bacterium]
MKSKLLKTAIALTLGLTVVTSAADGEFALKGNIQTQGIANNNDNWFESFWFRANVGGSYTSEDFDGQIMIRMFGPNFGNTIDGKNYDKFLADLYWGNYKWDLGMNKLNLKLGHWKTDWSQAGNFGTYVDPALSRRGMLMRDYSHDAFELGWKVGPSTLNAMLGTTDNKFNTGYVRVEERAKFSFPLELAVAYRVNAIDAFNQAAVQTHRVAGSASYAIIKNLRLYGEIAYITTGTDSDVNAKSIAAGDAIKPEYKQGSDYLPFFVGLEIPTAGIFDHLMFEFERINDRDELNAGADDFAWTVGLTKSFGRTKAQLNLYSEDELDDVAAALRFTTTIK